MNASRIGCRLILVFLVAICVVWSQVSDAAANDWDETSHDWDQMVEADGSGDVKASADEKWGYQAAPVAVPPASHINNVDDSIRLSNSALAGPDAQTYANDDQCDGRTLHTVTQPDGTISRPFVCAHYSSTSTIPTGYVPSTSEILYYAATTIHADGAGLHKRPSKVSYTNKYVPTLVAATHPTQTHVINLLGHDITITLKATNYEWDWGDGTPHTITAYHGMAFEKGMDPNKDPRLIRHYYTPPNGWRSRFDGPYPNATRTITLTTTWSGTATNPFTGETQTINGLVTTKETTGPFRLSHLIVSNTDTWEEKQGH